MGWNFAWLVDFRKSINNPMHTTDSLVGVYAIIINIFSSLFTFIVYSLYNSIP